MIAFQKYILIYDYDQTMNFMVYNTFYTAFDYIPFQSYFDPILNRIIINYDIYWENYHYIQILPLDINKSY